jgi:hypothetical protein
MPMMAAAIAPTVKTSMIANTINTTAAIAFAITHPSALTDQESHLSHR